MSNNTEKRNILVTSALPYANAPLHLGHILEHTQTDIWVRYQKLIGNNCTYVCVDDAHGTPIMLKAKELNKEPEDLIEEIYANHYAKKNKKGKILIDSEGLIQRLFIYYR